MKNINVDFPTKRQHSANTSCSAHTLGGQHIIEVTHRRLHVEMN